MRFRDQVGRVVWYLAALLFFASIASAQQTEQPLRIPFRTDNNMILVDVTVNGAKAVLMLDTGSTRTALNPEFVGVGKSDAVRAIHQGVHLHRTVNLQIAKHYWVNWQVLVVDIADRSLTRVDGLLGEDWLRTFSTVRIDYANHVIELEAK